MKIHIYRSSMDKIPVNAIPFYQSSDMNKYEEVREYYKKTPLI